MKHKITPTLRARMVDWMIEVLTNFKCEDQTFFLAVSLLDRYLKNKDTVQEIADLHLMGVTAMFIASKYEDIHPLKMKMVFEKISHKKLEEIRNGKNVPVPLYDLPRAPTPIAQVTRGKTEENKSYSQTTYKNHFAENGNDIPQMFEPHFVKLDKQVREASSIFLLLIIIGFAILRLFQGERN